MQLESRWAVACNELLRTNDHGGELEALADTLPVDLVGQVGEANEAHELFADDGRERMLLLGRGLLEGRRGAVHPVGGEGRVAVGGVVVGHGWGQVGDVAGGGG